MPQKRRVLSCSSCRRLKTKCTVLPGTLQCSRCYNLRLDCSLPSLNHVPRVAGVIQSVETERSHAERLDSIEASLVEIKELLRIRYDNETQASSRIADPIANKSDNIAQSMGFTRPLSTATLQGDRQKGFQIAPVATIRQFCESITGPAGAADSNAIFDDFLAIKADLEPIERQLLESFNQISARFRIIPTDISLWSTQSPLLLMACLLVGLQGLPLARCSSVYITLYSLVKDHLGKAVLNTPAETSTIQTLLIFSIWNLTPSYRDHYVDSWLVSGLAVQHSALAFNSNSHVNDVPHKNKSRLWTIAYLQNLKFAIGTGHFAVINLDVIEDHLSEAQELAPDDLDKSLLAELDLFLILYKTVVIQNLDLPEAWSEFVTWAEKYLTSNEASLTFAHASVSLILARWEATAVSYDPCSQSSQSLEAETLNTRVLLLEEMIIHHSQTILEQMMQLSARTRYVKPTYDFLLGAYAAMTLVEYAHSIQDVQKSHELMKRAVSEQKQIGPEEPVLSWAADMMRKKSLDVLPVDVPGDGVQNTQEHQRIWVPYDLINSRNSYLSD